MGEPRLELCGSHDERDWDFSYSGLMFLATAIADLGPQCLMWKDEEDLRSRRG